MTESHPAPRIQASYAPGFQSLSSKNTFPALKFCATYTCTVRCTRILYVYTYLVLKSWVSKQKDHLDQKGNINSFNIFGLCSCLRGGAGG